MEAYKKAISFLPDRLKRILSAYRIKESICEIRLRKNAPVTLTAINGNLFIDENGYPCKENKAVISSGAEIRETVKKFCQGSVYRYISTLSDGYIINDDGFRMGICPDKNGSLDLLPEDISGISIRIPRMIRGAADKIIDHYNSFGISSTLIISPPGAGKTTILRDLAYRLSRDALGSPKRCTVIDERREIFPVSKPEIKGLCDVISGYPKGKGMEIATRIFSPEIILCDEISNEYDASGILESIGSGVIIIATAHASDIDNLKKKPHLKMLCEKGAFDLCCSIKKKSGDKYLSELTFDKL